MNDVVQFPKKEPTPELIWTCHKCGCQSFTLYATGETSCARCDHRSSDAGEDQCPEHNWRKILPNPPKDIESIPPMTSENATIHVDAPMEFLRARVARSLTEDPVALVVIQREGSQFMWRELCETDEQEAWYRERIERFANFVLDRRKPGGA